MLSNKFTEALGFANNLHANQVRKGTTVPFFSHLMSVAALVIEHGGGENECIAALLHDAIEDQGHGYPGGFDGLRLEISKRFGSNVLEMVEECTDSDTYPKADWKTRKLSYIKHLESISPGGALVSCADKVHNVRCILRDHKIEGAQVWERFKGKREGTLWYYRELRDAFNKMQSIDGNLRDEFNQLVAQLEAVVTK